MLLHVVLLFLLACASVARPAAFVTSPKPSSPIPPPLLPSPHLTFSLNAHHSHSPPPPSRFHPLQSLVATSNMSGCASIDFSASVSINGQGPYRLIVDTGSTTLAVVSASCTSCDGATPTFIPNPTSQTNDGDQITATYGGGTGWTGYTWRSSVALGDSRAVSMQMATIDSNDGFINGASVCAVNGGAKVNLNTSQGIIGFAFPSVALPSTDSWVTDYVAATGISNEFTVQMCPAGGNVWVGGYDGAFVSGWWAYIPIISPYYYSVMLTDISVIDSSGSSVSTGYTQLDFGPCDAPTDCVILDSGSTDLILPSDVRTRLVALIRRDAYYQSVFDSVGTTPDPLQQTTECASASGLPSLATLQARLPKLTLTFTDASLANPQTFTLNSIPGYLSLNFDESGNAYYCNGLGTTSGAAVLGYSFMNQFTVRHDLQNRRLGLAPTAQCGVAAPPLPSYQWVVGGWGECNAQCGGGWQWRQVDCSDQWGVKHADLACVAVYLAPRPVDSQQCNTQACAASTPPTFLSLISPSTFTPGQSVTVSFTYSGPDPDAVVLFLTPSSSSPSLPSYITRNASAAGGAGSYTFSVPSSSTLPPATYTLGAYASTPYSPSSAYTSGSTVTVASCTSGSCGADPCASGSARCNGVGECDVVSSVAVCTCMPGWTGSTCATNQNTGIPTCLNGGTLQGPPMSCSCPPSFMGPQCEQPYANLSATLSTPSASVFTGANADAFSATFTTDLAFALGVFPHQVGVQSIVAAGGGGGGTTVLFSVQAQGLASDLIARVNSLFPTPRALSLGLASASITSLSVLSLPPTPSSSSQSARQFLSQYWPYILAGVGGFVLVFLVLYMYAGGRFQECRGRGGRRGGGGGGQDKKGGAGEGRRSSGVASPKVGKAGASPRLSAADVA